MRMGNNQLQTFLTDSGGGRINSSGIMDHGICRLQSTVQYRIVLVVASYGIPPVVLYAIRARRRALTAVLSADCLPQPARSEM